MLLIDSIVEVYEVNPATKEKIRNVKLSGHPFKSPMDPKKMKSFAIGYNSEGVGNASLMRVNVTDSNDNQYHSYIELKRKENPNMSKII